MDKVELRGIPFEIVILDELRMICAMKPKHFPHRRRPCFLSIFLSAFGLVALVFSGCSKRSTSSGGAADQEFIQVMYAGKNYLDKGEGQKAIEPFKKAVALNPTHPDAHLNLANACLLANQPEEAVNHAQEVLKLDSNSAAAYFVEGCAYLRLNKFEDADKALQESIKLDDKVAAAYFELGLAQQHLKQWDAAAKAFETATLLEPEHPAAYYNLSQVLVRAGKVDEANQKLETHRQIIAGLTNNAPTAATFEKSRHTLARVPFSLEQPDANGIKVSFSDVTQEAFGTAGGAQLYQGPIGVIDIRHDGQNDLFVCEGSDGFRLLINKDGKFTPQGQRLPGIAGATYSKCLIGDLQNDSYSDRGEDAVVLGPQGSHVFKITTNGYITEVTAYSHFNALQAIDGSLLDLYFTGKLDLLAVTRTNTLKVFRNLGNLLFKDITATSGVPASVSMVQSVTCDDWNNDDQMDIFATRTGQPPIALFQQRGGVLLPTNAVANLPAASVFAIGDLNNDLRPDLVLATQDKIECVFNGVAERQSLPIGNEKITSLTLVDYDNDGWLDICAAGDRLRIWRNIGRSGFKEVTQQLGLDKISGPIQSITVADFDRDGDSDILLSIEKKGLQLLRNEGGNSNYQLALRLLGNRSNPSGLGVKVEVTAGGLHLIRTVHQLPVEVGVGKHPQIESVTTHWFDFPMNDVDVKIEPKEQYTIMELILPTGSCPYLYAWDGHQFRFITDILGAAPVGLPVAEGHYIEADPDEYVWLGGEDRMKPKDGEYVLQVTEELREVLYLDEAKLVAVDHPAGTEIYPTDKLVPGKPFPPSELVTLHRPKPLVRATRHDGADVTELLKEVDGKFVSPTQLRSPQLRGLAEPHSVTLDFGPLDTDRPLVLALTGWLRFGGGMANIAASHNPDLPFPFPTLEVETGGGKWQPVPVTVGAPAGKTKRIIVDLAGKLPQGSKRLRLSEAFEIHWDQALLFEKADAANTRITSLLPAKTDLHWRGFSEFQDLPWYMPLTPNYESVSANPKWNITPMGWCTRYGEVGELLAQKDNAFVLINGGDEVTLSFSIKQLPEKPAGYVRDFYVFTVGWDKDSDFHVAYGTTVEPLPFHGMDDQLYGKQPRPVSAGDSWIEKYNTRWVGPRILKRPDVQASRQKVTKTASK